MQNNPAGFGNSSNKPVYGHRATTIRTDRIGFPDAVGEARTVAPRLCTQSGSRLGFGGRGVAGSERHHVAEARTTGVFRWFRALGESDSAVQMSQAGRETAVSASAAQRRGFGEAR